MTIFNGLLGETQSNQIGCLTLTNLNGLLGQNGEPPHFSEAKPQVWMQRRRTMTAATMSYVECMEVCFITIVIIIMVQEVSITHSSESRGSTDRITTTPQKNSNESYYL